MTGVMMTIAAVAASAAPAAASPSPSPSRSAFSPASPSPSTSPSSSGTQTIGTSVPHAIFGLGPATGTKIDGRPYFNWSGTPGSYLTDHVAVVNFGAVPVTVRFYLSNAVNTSHGGMGFVAGGTIDKAGPAAWATIHYPGNSQMLSLAPHSTTIVPVTVLIPRGAPPGDHVGAFIVAMTSTIESKNHAKVHFVQQVADRVISRISGNLRPGLLVTGLKVSYNTPLSPLGTSPASMTFTVKNTGNILLGGRVTVSVSGFFGTTETRKNVATVPVMLPGGTDEETVRVPGVDPEILMNARVSVVPTVVEGQYDPGLTTYGAEQGFLAIPWMLIAILILVISLVIGHWYRGRSGSNTARAAS